MAQTESVVVSVRLPKGLKDQLAAEAERREESLNSVIVDRLARDQAAASSGAAVTAGIEPVITGVRLVEEDVALLEKRWKAALENLWERLRDRLVDLKGDLEDAARADVAAGRGPARSSKPDHEDARSSLGTCAWHGCGRPVLEGDEVWRDGPGANGAEPKFLLHKWHE